MKQNKKIFIFSYSALIIIIILSVAILSMLGNIQRIGYLSDFDHILENKYYFKLKFDSKIFKNNKIYTVCPNTNEMPENVTNIRWSGTYYGNLVIGDSSIQLNKNDKIDNIKYKLKINNNVIFFALFIIILFPILYFYIIPSILKNYKAYIFLFILNAILYLSVINFIMPSFSMMHLKFNIYDFLYSYLFTMTAYSLLFYNPLNKRFKNIRIILASLFCIISNFESIISSSAMFSRRFTYILFNCSFVKVNIYAFAI